MAAATPTTTTPFPPEAPTPPADYLDVDVPDLYKGIFILQENITLVKQLFPISPCSSNDDAGNKNLLHFLEMYKEVFAHCPGFSSGSDVQLELKKFRQVYRKSFRGVAYLSSVALGRAHLTAMKVAEETGQPISDDLYASIELEQAWIDRINDFKRSQVVESIKADAFEAFKERVHQAIRSNPDGVMEFYDDAEVESFDKLRVTAVKDFRKEIPFETDLKMLAGFEREFEGLLNEKVRNPLVEANTENRAKAKAFMDSVIEDLVEMYKKAITVVQKSPLMELDEIQQCHQDARENCMKKFEEMETPGKSQFHKEYRIKLDEQIYATFAEIMDQAHASAKVRIQSVLAKSKEEVEVCVGKIGDILGKHCSVKWVDQIKKIFDDGLASTIGRMQDVTLASENELKTLLGMAHDESKQNSASRVKKSNPVSKRQINRVKNKTTYGPGPYVKTAYDSSTRKPSYYGSYGYGRPKSYEQSYKPPFMVPRAGIQTLVTDQFNYNDIIDGTDDFGEFDLFH